MGHALMETRAGLVVDGGGLAGLMATVRAAEMGMSVDLFSIVPVKRSHSVCAQGGINGAVNTKGEGDSPDIHFDDTIYGGDFLAEQPPVKAMCYAAPGIINLLDRMGVPFNRTPEGLLDFRRGGNVVSMTWPGWTDRFVNLHVAGVTYSLAKLVMRGIGLSVGIGLGGDDCANNNFEFQDDTPPITTGVPAASVVCQLMARCAGTNAAIDPSAAIGTLPFAIAESCAATIAGTSRLRMPAFSAAARIRRASSTRSCSARLLPTDLPWARAAEAGHGDTRPPTRPSWEPPRDRPPQVSGAPSGATDRTLGSAMC